MQDTLISFKTAKLALEVGSNVGPSIFNWEVEYLDNNKVKVIELDLIIDLEDFKEDLRLPTQSLLQKYLREKHNIHISIDFAQADDNTINWYIQISEMTWVKKDLKYTKIDDRTLRYFKLKSYENALEKGLYEALKLIKNE